VTADPFLVTAREPSGSGRRCDEVRRHYCLGAPLARIELKAVFSQLLARFPAMRLAVPLEQLRMRSGSVIGGLTKLPVEW
jgi:hypothetical protein